MAGGRWATAEAARRRAATAARVRRPALSLGRGGRGPRRRPAGQLGDVRGALPRERGAGAVAAAAPARVAHAAVAAAAALGGAARRGQPVRLVPDHRRDVPRMPGRPVRPAGPARDPRGSGAARDRGPRRGDGRGVAVRRLAALRLPRRLHVRGRRPAGGEAGGRAGAGSRSAARAARPGGAARSDRSGGTGGPGAGAPGARPRAGRAVGGCVARPAAPAGRSLGRGGRGADRGAAGRRGVAPRAGGLAPRHRPAHRRRGSLDRHRGCGPIPRRPRSGAAGRAFRRPSWRRWRTLSAASWRAGLAGTVRSTPRSRRGDGRCRWLGSRRRSSGCWKRARSCAASSGPGGTEREWCDPEVLRQLRRRSLARLRREVEPVEQVVLARFLPAWQGVGRSRERRRGGPARSGRGGARTAGGGGRSAGGRADPGLRPGARRPARPDSRLPAAPAGRDGRSRRGGVGGAGQPRPRRRAGRPVPPRSSGAARSRGRRRRAAARRDPRPAARPPAPARRLVLPRAGVGGGARLPSARSSTRCGTWSGPARSPTTRSPRSARCAGGALPASGGRGRGGC